jgi:hypothetical protein
MDFEDSVRGEWITTKWLATDGLTIHVNSTCGYQHFQNNLQAARIFDTSNPGLEPEGDPDLGSPNAGCQFAPYNFGPNELGTWPGTGWGGDPRFQTNPNYWNCVPQGKVLIVDENGATTPDDALCGGTIYFDIDTPSLVTSLGILDVKNGYGLPVEVSVTDSNNAVATFFTPYVGDNGFYDMVINVPNAVQVQVRFPNLGAISYLKYLYCP